jgi:periplasmic divalent cation tolerance protein
MDDAKHHALTLITCGTTSEAQSIARHLVESRLAAGVQIIPIGSVYAWDDEVVEDHEWLLIAKTRRDRFEQIMATVNEMHSYLVPPVLMFDIDSASAPYLEWIDANVEHPR